MNFMMWLVTTVEVEKDFRKTLVSCHAVISAVSFRIPAVMPSGPVALLGLRAVDQEAYNSFLIDF